MKRHCVRFSIGWLLWSALCGAKDSQAQAQAAFNPPVAIGTRVEMLVDNWLVDSNRTRGISLKLHTPIRREVVLTTDKPWDCLLYTSDAADE